MNKYDEILKNAENYLKKCKACSTCVHSFNSVANNSEILEFTTFCVKNNADVTRKSGFMCENYSPIK